MAEVSGVSGYQVYRYDGKEIVARVSAENGEVFQEDIPKDLPKDAGGYSIAVTKTETSLWQLEIDNVGEVCFSTNLTPLATKAKAILSGIMELQPGQKALILYDQPKRDLGEAFVAGAKAIGAEVTGYMLPESRFKNGVLEGIVSRIKTGDYAVCVNIFEGRPEEVGARVAILNVEEEKVPRTAHSPGLTAEMLNLPGYK